MNTLEMLKTIKKVKSLLLLGFLNKQPTFDQLTLYLNEEAKMDNALTKKEIFEMIISFGNSQYFSFLIQYDSKEMNTFFSFENTDTHLNNIRKLPTETLTLFLSYFDNQISDILYCETLDRLAHESLFDDDENLEKIKILLAFKLQNNKNFFSQEFLSKLFFHIFSHNYEQDHILMREQSDFFMFFLQETPFQIKDEDIQLINTLPYLKELLNKFILFDKLKNKLDIKNKTQPFKI